MPRLLTQEERQQISLELARTESAPTKLSDEVLSLARDLSAIHGRIRVSVENHGTHFYMASPACLIEDYKLGSSEKLAADDVPALFLPGWPKKDPFRCHHLLSE
jgi:hypothetical protein